MKKREILCIYLKENMGVKEIKRNEKNNYISYPCLEVYSKIMIGGDYFPTFLDILSDLRRLNLKIVYEIPNELPEEFKDKNNRILTDKEILTLEMFIFNYESQRLSYPIKIEDLRRGLYQY